MDFLVYISNIINNQRLKIELLAVLSFLNMMDGSDCDCETHNIGFQSPNSNKPITALYIVYAQLEPFLLYGRDHGSVSF